MAHHKESNGWMAVPAFGDWDMKNGMPDYSMDFSKIRQMRKQNKNDFNRGSIGTEDEFSASASAATKNGQLSKNEPIVRENHDTDSTHGRKKFMSYFQCCVGAA